MKKVLYILGLLEDRDVTWLVGAGQRRAVVPGEVLVREGESSASLFIVITGKVQVTVKKHPVAEIGVGEVLGEISLLDSRPPSATVTALVPTTVLAIGFDSLRAKLERDQGFAARLYQALGVFLAQRLRKINIQLTGGDVAKINMNEDVENSDEIDPEVFDRITLAGSRFAWIIDKLSGRQ